MKKYWKIFFWIAIIAGISTVVPAPASKVSLLGYRAHCSFTPVSTIMCFVAAWLFRWREKKKVE